MDYAKTFTEGKKTNGYGLSCVLDGRPDFMGTEFVTPVQLAVLKDPASEAKFIPAQIFLRIKNTLALPVTPE